MAAPRLAASVEAASLVRRATAAGDFAAVLRKGDPERGAIVILVRSRGKHAATLERTLGADGSYNWQEVGPRGDESAEKLAEFLERRISFDPDIWLIELDIAQAERFIAETTLSG